MDLQKHTEPRPSELRASDADRDRIADLLREALAEGRLTPDEHAERVELPVPAGLKGTYALTVERVSGGAVYASRTLVAPVNGISAFTVQTLPDDRGTVAVPDAEQDLSVLQK